MGKDKPKKILIIKLGAMGDVIHSTIIATAIKQKHPDWQVDFLSTSYYADIIKTHPHIDNVIYFDATKRKSYTYLFKMALDLFKTRYDIIFNLTRAMRNNLLARLAFPKKYKGKMCFETSWVEEYFLTAKSVIRDIELPKRLYINLPDIDFDRVDNIINDCPKPYIIISPGGATDVSRQGRIWSLEKWKELINKIQEDFSGTIFVCGSFKEKEKHAALKTGKAKVITGEINTAEMSLLISKSDLMISGDTGPVHVASAYNIKTLVLLGSTSTDKIKPFGDNGYYISSNHDCLYCWKKKCPHLKEGEIYTPCMEAISVDSVLKKVKEIYNMSS